ncbi:alpha/beta hydrolase [Spongiimicrobium sp. 3-5]|uniref:alpha/beta hydrolase n=1 Tax=Spongiimicrobium sp. 3-5 TaxID=3332596 RepID=UPI00398102F3
MSSNHSYDFPQPFKEVFLSGSDGAKLNAIHFQNNHPKGVLLYFHGNAGDLSRWGDIAGFFVDKNYDVVVMDYRTYGKSTGKLSEKALYTDAQLFYDYVLENYGEDQIILYGRSLGSGIAAQLASKNVPAQLIMETPYYSLLDVAKDRFPFLPVSWLLKYKIPSYDFVTRVTCPITIFHGTDDNVVPYDSGKRLFDSISNNQKKMFTIKGGEHNNLIQFDTYLNGIDEILKTN